MFTKKRRIQVVLGATLLTSIFACSSTKKSTYDFSDLVMRMEVKEPIEGICDANEVYVLLPFEGNGQIKPEPPLSDEDLETKLNTEVAFLKKNDNFKGKGMIGLVVNCKGELVKCEMDNVTKSTELDEQIETVFKTMINWKPGSLKGSTVDVSILYSFEINDGNILLN